MTLATYCYKTLMYLKEKQFFKKLIQGFNKLLDSELVCNCEKAKYYNITFTIMKNKLKICACLKKAMFLLASTSKVNHVFRVLLVKC